MTAAALAAALLAGPAVAGSMGGPPPGWIVDRYGASDGLTTQLVNDVARDGDGFVWLSTYDGLARFDGLRFEMLRASDPDGPPSARVRFVARHPTDGAMWLITEAGQLQRRRRGEVRTWPLDAIRAAYGFGVGEASLWVVARQGAVFRLDTEPIAVDVPVVSREGRMSFLVSGPGPTLHLFDATGWWSGHEDGGPWTRVEADRPLDHVVWERDLRTGGPVGRLGDQALSVDLTSGATHLGPASQMVGPNTPPRPLVAREAHLALADELGLRDRALTLGVEGPPYWRLDGPARVRPALVSSWSPPVDRPANITRLWWDDVTATLWAHEQGTGWWPASGAPDATLPPPDDPDLCPAANRRYHRGLAGDLWLSCPREVFRREADRWVTTGPPSLDKPGPVWTTRRGLVLGGERTPPLLQDGDTWHPIAAPDGAWPGLYGLAELPDGHLVLAGRGQLLLLPPDRLAAAPFPGAEAVGGRPLGTVRHLALREGWLWLSTVDHGLCAWPLDGAPIRCLGAAALDGHDTVHATLTDGRGRTWLSTNDGLGVVESARLVRWAEGGEAPAPLWLGTDDGMASAEGNGFLGDAAVRTPDGRLWFATQDGAAVVDPARVTLPPAPAVHVTRAAHGDVRLSHPDQVTLDTHHVPLHVQWTAPVELHAEQVGFRYRLGPAGRWSGWGSERSLSLPTVAPGESALEVQARLGDAVGPAARLVIRRAPALTEWAVFPLLVGLALALLAGLAALGRARWLKRLNDRLTARVEAQTVELSTRNTALESLATTLATQNHTLAEQTGLLEERADRIAVQARRLAELDGAKRQLIANVSHELRTPLSLIVGPLGTLRTRTEDPSARRVLGTAIDNAERLDTLISQLFELSRAQAGGTRLRVRKVDLYAVIRDVVQRFRDRADEARVTLDAGGTGPAWIWAERDRLDKVLSNLVANALRYTPAGGSVAVSVHAEPEALRVEVADTGPGVPADQQASVFERFFQVEGRAGGGAGLGLALASELVELHGGRFGVRDARPGAEPPGACFWFTLPLGAAHLAPEEVDLTPEPRPVSVEPPAGEVDGQTVLVVEDHDALRAYLAEILGEQFRVVVARDGQEALERLATGDPVDAVVSDIMMPRVDGLELVRRLRSSEAHAKLPVVFVSARQEIEDRVGGLELADDYVTKPFSAPELVARVAAVLRRARPESGREAPPLLNPLEARLQEVAGSRLGDASFTAGPLAKAMAMSPRTLQAQMRDAGLSTPSEWLRAARIHRARAIMAEGRLTSVGEVAAAVGMSRSYFSRMYGALVGNPPGEDMTG